MAAPSLSGGRVWGWLPRRMRLWMSVGVLALLLWFLLGALARQADRASVTAERVILNQLRAALVIKTAEIGLSRQRAYRDWIGINPMSLLDAPPVAYDGLCAGPLHPGHWCFEVAGEGEKGPTGALRYRSTVPAPQKETGNYVQNWMVVLEYNDSNGNNQRDDDDRVTGLKLSPSPERIPTKTRTKPGG